MANKKTETSTKPKSASAAIPSEESRVPTVPTAIQATAPSEPKVNDGEPKAAKAKAKEAKPKKQVAVEPAIAEVVVTETDTASVSKKGTSEPASEKATEKATKMKRLTLDIAKPLHKAIKAKAVEEGVPMVDMLRSLLEENYGK